MYKPILRKHGFSLALSILLIGSLFITSSCGGGGGGGGSAGPAPSITRMDVFNGQTGWLSVSLDFLDSGGDVATVTANLYNATHTLMGSDTTPIPGITGMTSGTITGDLDFSSLAIGHYSLDIYLTDSSGLQSNVVSKAFSVEGGFGTAVNYPNPSNYLYLGDTAIGDLNGDGRNDVVAIQGSNNTGLLLIYYQNSSGGLDSPVAMNLDIQTRGVAIADVNNDGKADLILSGLSTNALIGYLGRIVVFLQDPATGQLLPPQEYTVSSEYAFGVAVADLNADGKNDILAGQVGMPGGLSIFFQNDDGTLGSEVINNSVNVMFGEIHVADMDNDGLNDIVVQSGPKELAVIRQISPGVFSATPDRYVVETSYWPNFSAFALGDLNGDGRTDMVAVDPGNNAYINIFLQNSQGKLEGPVVVQITDVPFGVKIADITGDGLNDLVMDISGGIVVFPQQSDHTFGSKRYYAYQATSYGGSTVYQALSIGDVTGDGNLDAVVTWLDEGLYVFPYAVQLVIH